MNNRIIRTERLSAPDKTIALQLAGGPDQLSTALALPRQLKLINTLMRILQHGSPAKQHGPCCG